MNMNNNYSGFCGGWQEPRQSYMLPTQMSGTSQPANNDERIWVNGEAQARDYLIAPNGFVRLWDSNEPKFYEKKADVSGRPILETYEYRKIEGTTKPKTAQNGFIGEGLKEEIEGLKRRILVLERGGNEDVQ